MKKYLNVLLLILFILFIASTIHLVYLAWDGFSEFDNIFAIINIVIALLFLICLIVNTIINKNIIILVFSILILIGDICITYIHINYLMSTTHASGATEYPILIILIALLSIIIVPIYYIVNKIKSKKIKVTA